MSPSLKMISMTFSFNVPKIMLLSSSAVFLSYKRSSRPTRNEDIRITEHVIANILCNELETILDQCFHVNMKEVCTKEMGIWNWFGTITGAEVEIVFRPSIMTMNILIGIKQINYCVKYTRWVINTSMH